MTVEEMDVVRHREIASKAVSAILLLTLKWFKVSRRLLTSMIDLTDYYFPRYYEVPPSWVPAPRFELPSPDLEDVWSSRGICFSDIEVRLARVKVSLVTGERRDTLNATLSPASSAIARSATRRTNTDQAMSNPFRNHLPSRPSQE